jgi:hypothetical protein
MGRWYWWLILNGAECKKSTTLLQLPRQLEKLLGISPNKYQDGKASEDEKFQKLCTACGLHRKGV